MAVDLWDQSSEDVRERWRDIARALRESGDAEALPRALQAAFWFGVEATRRAAVGPRFDVTLRSLLPPEKADAVRAQPARPVPKK